MRDWYISVAPVYMGQLAGTGISPRRVTRRTQILQEFSYRLAHDPGRVGIAVAANQVTGNRIDSDRSRMWDCLDLGLDVVRQVKLVAGVVDEQRLRLDRGQCGAQVAIE